MPEVQLSLDHLKKAVEHPLGGRFGVWTFLCSLGLCARPLTKEEWGPPEQKIDALTILKISLAGPATIAVLPSAPMAGMTSTQWFKIRQSDTSEGFAMTEREAEYVAWSRRDVAMREAIRAKRIAEGKAKGKP